MSAMLRNTKKLALEMSDSNRGYAKDLQSAFLEVQKVVDLPESKRFSLDIDDTHALTVKNNRDFLNKRKPGQRPEKPDRKRTEGESDPPPMEIEEPSRKTPKWAKALYRSIVILTHPDKVQSNEGWSALKKEKYSQIGLKVVDAYSNEQYADLISLGCEIDVFSKDLAIRQQLTILNQDYSTQIKEIDGVQASVAWKWGSFWTSPTDRVKIIQGLCINAGFQPPSVKKIEEILKNLEFID